MSSTAGANHRTSTLLDPTHPPTTKPHPPLLSPPHPYNFALTPSLSTSSLSTSLNLSNAPKHPGFATPPTPTLPPPKILLTAPSTFFPFTVTGTSPTSTTNRGTCRGLRPFFIASFSAERSWGVRRWPACGTTKRKTASSASPARRREVHSVLLKCEVKGGDSAMA